MSKKVEGIDRLIHVLCGRRATERDRESSELEVTASLAAEEIATLRKELAELKLEASVVAELVCSKDARDRLAGIHKTLFERDQLRDSEVRWLVRVIDGIRHATGCGWVRTGALSPALENEQKCKVAHKVFTHDLRSPLQGGDPVWDGSLPYELPPVKVDESYDDCAAGWNACRRPEDAIAIAGLWYDGWPARLYRVETSAPVVERGDKLRASTWTIVEELDMRVAVEPLSAVFGVHAKEMIEAQLAWHRALGRPHHDPERVERGLRQALEARGLGWALRRCGTAQEVWEAREAWKAREPWEPLDQKRAWDAWDKKKRAWDAWDKKKRAWDAWDAWDSEDACEARDACIWRYAALKDWVYGPPDKYDIGIRDAFEHGLELALPTAPDELGWAMEG